MKKPALFFLMLLSLLAVTSYSQKNDIKGVYKMIRQAHVEGDKDSLLKREQIKFYTGKYMLHASPKHNDSAGEFGIGKYIFDGNTLTEYVFYSSVAGDMKDTFELKITPGDKGFIQDIEFELQTNRKFILTEVYERIGRPGKTPLDGVWQLETAMIVGTDGDTSVDNRIQYKVFQNGYFAWVNAMPDAEEGTPATSFGYGTFTLSGKSLKENNINSTYHNLLVGHDTNLTVDLLGNNRFRQTINGENGEKYIEVYNKLE